MSVTHKKSEKQIGAAELEAQKFRLGEKWSGGLGYGRIRNVVAFWPPKVENVLNPHSLR